MAAIQGDSQPGRVAWFLAGYAGLGGFFGLELAARERGTAARLDAGSEDRATTRRIVAAHALVATVAPFLRRTPSRRLPCPAAPLGLLLQIAGLSLRAWSMRTLAAAYSRTLRIEADQSVIDHGPYQLIRHPGYLGSLLIWLGFGLSSSSLPVVASAIGLVGGAYRRRISAEEELLSRHLPGYVEYTRRTWRLIPFVW